MVVNVTIEAKSLWKQKERILNAFIADFLKDLSEASKRKFTQEPHIFSFEMSYEIMINSIIEAHKKTYFPSKELPENIKIGQKKLFSHNISIIDEDLLKSSIKKKTIPYRKEAFTLDIAFISKLDLTVEELSNAKLKNCIINIEINLSKEETELFSTLKKVAEKYEKKIANTFRTEAHIKIIKNR